MSEMPGRPLTEMEWRVGRAIYEATPRARRWENASEAVRLRCLQRAHDVIAAMREPSEAMQDAGALPRENRKPVADIWRAMIAVALGEANRERARQAQRTAAP